MNRLASKTSSSLKTSAAASRNILANVAPLSSKLVNFYLINKGLPFRTRPKTPAIARGGTAVIKGSLKFINNTENGKEPFREASGQGL